MNCSEYRIVEIDNDDLPPGHDWILIDEPHAVTFAVKSGCMSAQVVAEGWAAYRKVMRGRVGGPNARWLRAAVMSA